MKSITSRVTDRAPRLGLDTPYVESARLVDLLA